MSNEAYPDSLRLARPTSMAAHAVPVMGAQTPETSFLPHSEVVTVGISVSVGNCPVSAAYLVLKAVYLSWKGGNHPCISEPYLLKVSRKQSVTPPGGINASFYSVNRGGLLVRLGVGSVQEPQLYVKRGVSRLVAARQTDVHGRARSPCP